MKGFLKGVLKTLRSSQPFNYVATTGIRAVLSAFGLQSELVIKHLHRVGIVRVRLPNGHRLRLWSRGDDWISNQIFWRGWEGYESETVPLFFRLAQRSQVTLDVGAYVGLFSVLAAQANRRGRVFAFEPLPPIFGRLKRNIAWNRLTNVRCFCVAVGEDDGTAEFFHTADELPSSSSLSPEFMQSYGELQRSVVPVMTLDRWIEEQQLPRVDLMKIDTESTEPQVLRGMQQTLRRDHPHLLCEVLPGSGTGAQLKEILQPLGYQFYLLTPQGPIEKDDIEGHPEWLNYLFTTMKADELSRI